MASDELAKKLERRNILNEAGEDDENVPKIQPSMKVFNPYTEFPEFTRKEIQGYEKTFKQYVISTSFFCRQAGFYSKSIYLIWKHCMFSLSTHMAYIRECVFMALPLWYTAWTCNHLSIRGN